VETLWRKVRTSSTVCVLCALCVLCVLGGRACCLHSTAVVEFHAQEDVSTCPDTSVTCLDMAWLFTVKEGCMEAVLIINSVSLDGELHQVLPDRV